MKDDICCETIAPITGEQARTAVRMLNLLFPPLPWATIPEIVRFHLTHSGISGDFTDILGGSLSWPVYSEPLSAEGTFNPRLWTSPGPEEVSALIQSMVPGVIRAIWQKQMKWTCPKLPDLVRLAQLLDVFEPGVGWGVGEVNRVPSILLEVSGTRYRILEMLPNDGVTLAPWSKQLWTEEECWRRFPHPPADLERKVHIADAVERLSRFLPHLIALIGDVEFD